MNALNIDIIVYFTLAASLGMLFGSIKMYRTAPPKLGIKRPLERDF